jgi:hypothetical protein
MLSLMLGFGIISRIAPASLPTDWEGSRRC